MGKEKEIKFNPADYDYMDKIPLAGWIWEFVRRNKGYMKFFKFRYNEMIGTSPWSIRPDLEDEFTEFCNEYPIAGYILDKKTECFIGQWKEIYYERENMSVSQIRKKKVF